MTDHEKEEVMRIFNECVSEDEKRKKVNFVSWYKEYVEPLEERIEELDTIIINAERANGQLKMRLMKAKQDAFFQRQRAQKLADKLKGMREANGA